MVVGYDLDKLNFNKEELHDIKNIREINKNSSKELAIYVDEVKGHIPIFGYPLMCYSPNESLN